MIFLAQIATIAFLLMISGNLAVANQDRNYRFPPPDGYRLGNGRICSVPGDSDFDTAKLYPNYRLSDLHKSGVPKLTSAQEKTLNTILKYVPPRNLWIAFLSPSTGHEFIIFADAYDTLCAGGEPIVLNGACPEIYNPRDPGYTTITDAEGCAHPERPWSLEDRQLKLPKDPSYWKKSPY